jgi:acyl-CoA hydrolase
MSDTIPSVPDGPHLRTIAMPRDTNAAGAIFGGWTISQMDLACATLPPSERRAGLRPSATTRCASFGQLRLAMR